VKVPLAVEKNGHDGYLAWVDGAIHQPSKTLRHQEPIYGHGSTEDTAVADLLRNLGYEEAK
jgi:hypothetical protein